MKTRHILLTLALACGCGLTATAQEDNILRLSLEEAQQYAVEHNYSMQNAALDVQNAEASRWQTIASMLPQATASFDYTNMCGYEMNFSGISIPMNPYGTFGITASIALTGAQIVGAVINDIAVDMADITKRQTEQTTRANVRSIYSSILVMEETVGLLDSSLANMQRLYETTQASVNAGAAEQVSADQLQVQVATLRNSVSSTRLTLKALYNSLILALGADVNARIVLTTPVAQIIDIDRAAALTNTQFTIEDNYNYQLLQQNEKIAKDQITLAWMDCTPTISAYYQYNNKTYFGKSEGMNMTPPNMIGASVSLPLVTIGSRAAKIKSAKISYQETVNSKQQAEDALRVQFNQLCYDLITAVETYRIQRENLDVTRRVFDNTAEKFKHGYASNLEVTNASTDIITAQSNYIQAVLSVVNAQVSLENLLGL